MEQMNHYPKISKEHTSRRFSVRFDFCTPANAENEDNFGCKRLKDVDVADDLSIALYGAKRSTLSRNSSVFVTTLLCDALLVAIDFLLVSRPCGERKLLLFGTFSSTIRGIDFWLSLLPAEYTLPCFDKFSSLSSAGRDTNEPKRRKRNFSAKIDTSILLMYFHTVHLCKFWEFDDYHDIMGKIFITPALWSNPSVWIWK